MLANHTVERRSPFTSRRRRGSVLAGAWLSVALAVTATAAGPAERPEPVAARQTTFKFTRVFTVPDMGPVVELVAGPQDMLYVVSARAVTVVTGSGVIQRTILVEGARGVLLNREGKPLFYRKSEILVEGALGIALRIPRVNGQARLLRDIPAAAVLSSSQMLLADRETHSVARFDESGKYIGIFGIGDPDRIRVGPGDAVALLDRNRRSINVQKADGTTLAPRITALAGSPVDMAYGPSGNLHVLDRAGAVIIYDRQSKVIGRFAGDGSRAFKRPVAIAVAQDGRLFVVDETAGILVFG